LSESQWLDAASAADSQRNNRAHMDIGSRSLAGSYDSYYFAHGCGRPYHRDDSWLDFFDSIAERIVAGINPATALDCGCALGFLVEALRRRGVAADGIDVSEFAIQNVHPDIAQHCRLGSATDPFGQRYDLIICIEVLEHLPSTDADRAVRNFTQFTNDVLLCSTPFDYSEATHVNVQPPDYWAELLARYGFIRDVDFDASFIAPWAVRFRRSSEPLPRIVQAYERRDAQTGHRREGPFLQRRSGQTGPSGAVGREGSGDPSAQ
jgi:hypothetical protein